MLTIRTMATIGTLRYNRIRWGSVRLIDLINTEGNSQSADEEYTKHSNLGSLGHAETQENPKGQSQDGYISGNGQTGLDDVETVVDASSVGILP